MNDAHKKADKETPSFAAQIGAKASRKQHAKRTASPGVWFGLGMMGLVGWSVVMPTLMGAALGLWLDRRYPGSHSWTLALLMAGLAMGCFNAWRWVVKEEHAIHVEQDT